MSPSPPINSPTPKEASRRRSFGFLSSSRKTSYTQDRQSSIPEATTPSSDANSPLNPSLSQDSNTKSNPTVDSADQLQPEKTSVWYHGKRYTTDDLWQAVQGNELDKITRCLKAGLSINYCQWSVDGIASLVDRAITRRSTKTLALLLRSQPDLTGSNKARYIQNQKRQYGEKWYNLWSSRKFEKSEPNDWNAPLHLAAKLGSLDAMRLLLQDAKADPNVMDSKGRTPLFHAVTSGSPKALEVLLDHGAQIEWTNQMNVTPLHASVIRGDLDVLKALVKHGALLDKFDTYGETALYDAVARGNSSIVKYLAEVGADLDIKNDAGINAYFNAASNFDAKMMRLLGDLGADIDVRDRNGCSALTRAVAAGNTQLIVALLENGVDIDVADNDGWTALDVAMIKKDETLVTLLLLNGASLQIKDARGNTTLHRAAARGTTTLIRHLLAVKDQDSNVLNSSTLETPLHLAAAQGNRPAVRLLLQYGANPNSVDRNGDIPLHRAILRGSLATVRELCSHPDVHLESLRTTVSRSFDSLQDAPDDTDLRTRRKAIARFMQTSGLDIQWPKPPAVPASPIPSQSILIPTPTMPPPPPIIVENSATDGRTGSSDLTTPSTHSNPRFWDDEPSLLRKKRGLPAKPSTTTDNKTSNPQSKAKPAAEVQVTARGAVVPSSTTTAATVSGVNGLNASSPSPSASASASSTSAAAASAASATNTTTTNVNAKKKAGKEDESEKDATDPFEASIPKPSPEKMDRIIERYIVDRHGGGGEALRAGLEGVNAGLQIANGIMSLL